MSEKRAEIEFPVEWLFRIIFVKDAEMVRERIGETFLIFGMAPLLEETRASATGKYQTIEASVVIPNRMVFDELPKALSMIPGIKMVL